MHPHYRAQRPLDATLLKTHAGLDDFISEKYHDDIAGILATWQSSLLRSPQALNAFEESLAPNFSGSSFLPARSTALRTDHALAVHHNEFTTQTNTLRNAFLQEFRLVISVFSRIITAEFQVTRIEASSTLSNQVPARLWTRVRYELVGAGEGFHREQRVGYWDLEWIPAPTTRPRFLLQRWLVLDETQSRSVSPIFTDVAASALAGNSSYYEQILNGVDHWRTVLDAACGIDIYGHNGISVADIDNDGFDDLYICQPAGLPNRLYRNRGDGTFEDITEMSGLGILENTACALFADFNNNGLQDAIIVRASGPLLFLNEGGGKFRRKPEAFQFATSAQGTFTGAAVADYDRDGWLDIYFCLYAYYQGTDQYKYPVPYHDAENGPPNFMFRNNRDGSFRDVTAEAGLNQNNRRYSFCCGWGDYNDDGWPDLYVVNDFGRKNLYRNNGDGTFTDVATQAGVGDVGAGMSVSWFDYDNDGSSDIYVGNMWSAAGARLSAQPIFKKDSPEEVRALYRQHAMGNSLFRNTGFRNTGLHNSGSEKSKRRFEDKTVVSGVQIGRWAWSSDSFDFDHDGFSDLYIANGMISGPSREDLNSFFWRQVVAKSPDQQKPSPDYEQGWSAINELIRADATWSGYERNVFYVNNRDGTFSDVSGAVELDFLEDGRAFALVDSDHDGRQEIFLKNRSSPQLRLMKNVMENLPPSISFLLRGTKSNRDAIGATVTLETEKGRQTRALQAGSGFLSQHSKEVFFGLGDAKGLRKATIRWPSGLVQQVHGLPANHRIWVEEGSKNFRTEAFKRYNAPRSTAVDTRQEAQTPSNPIETWLLAPLAAPDFSLPDLAGNVRNLAQFRGKPVLLNFWVAAAADCLQDLKLFNGLNAQWAAQGLQLLTVNLGETSDLSSLAKLARDQHFSFPILRGSEDTAAIYNILYRYLFDRHRDIVLPTSFLIDDKGQIVKIYQGALNADRIEKDFRRIPQTDAARLALALSFTGVSEAFEFARNYLSYGSVFFQRGYFEQAASFFQLALRDDPSSAEACYGLGSAYLSLEKTAEARENFERATRLHASYPDTLANAWNNLGLLATRENRIDEAVRRFKEALRLNPDHLIALNNLGNAYRAAKNWGAARKVFEHALEVSPSDPEANYGLAMVFAAADDTPHAYEYLQLALKARPAYPEALNNLGILYLRTQRRNEAVESFEQCIRVAPEFDQAYLNLARIYALEGASEKARSILLDLLKQHPGHPQAQNMLAQLPQ